jgi:hypothetical protein
LNEQTQAFGFYHGASWMDRDGNIYLVPGFHEEWIQAHPDLAQDCRTVVDMVIYKRWVSIVVFSKGYVEICLNDVADSQTVSLIHAFLERNAERWKNALLMPMKDEGFIQVAREDFRDLPSFAKLLADEMKKASS